MKNRLPITIISIALTLTVAGVGFYFYQKNIGSKKDVNTGKDNTNGSLNNLEVIDIKNENQYNESSWKVYQDKKYSIKFNYPDNWQMESYLSEDRESLFFVDKDTSVPYEMVVTFYENKMHYFKYDGIDLSDKTNRDLVDLLKMNPLVNNIGKIESMNFSGIILTKNGNGTNNNILIENGNSLICVSFEIFDEHDKTYNLNISQKAILNSLVILD